MSNFNPHSRYTCHKKHYYHTLLMATRRSYRQLVKKKCLEADTNFNRDAPVYDLSLQKITHVEIPQVLKYVADHHQKHHSKQGDVTLDLSRNLLTQISVRLIARTDWSILSGLYLQKCNFGSKVCKFLAKNDWPNLKQLSSALNFIGDEGCRFISRAHCPKLNYITVRYNNVQSAGCRALSQSNFPKDLRLYLSSNEIGRVGYLYLKDKYPEVQCDFIYCNQVFYNSQE